MTTNGHDYSINHKLNDISKENTSKENINEIGSFICTYCYLVNWIKNKDFYNCKFNNGLIRTKKLYLTIRWMKKSLGIKEEDGWFP